MSVPADKKVLDGLQKMIEKNKAAGDWVCDTLPNSFVGISVEETSPDDMLKLVGKHPLPKRPK